MVETQTDLELLPFILHFLFLINIIVFLYLVHRNRGKKSWLSQDGSNKDNVRDLEQRRAEHQMRGRERSCHGERKSTLIMYTLANIRTHALKCRAIMLYFQGGVIGTKQWPIITAVARGWGKGCPHYEHDGQRKRTKYTVPHSTLNNYCCGRQRNIPSLILCKNV